jgi:hypothetical protein
MKEPWFKDPLLLRSIPLSARPSAQQTMRVLERPEISTSTFLIQDTNWHVAGYPEIYVEGELVQIPYRIHYSWPGQDVRSQLTPDEQLVLACWMTRHHDGRVRQEALSLVFLSEVSWTIPFVVQLCGEYVIEVGEDVCAFFNRDLTQRPALQQAYKQFLNENPEFLSLTEQRAMSYWLDDYQTKMPQDNYPQLAALKLLAQLMP